MVCATHTIGEFGAGLFLVLPHDPYLLLALRRVSPIFRRTQWLFNFGGELKLFEAISISVEDACVIIGSAPQNL